MTSLPYTPSLPPPPAKKRGPADITLALAAKREYGLLIVIALIVITATLRDATFLSPLNIRDILVNCTQPAIVACGVMLVIVTGEIDISVGASLGLCTALCGTLMSADKYPQWFGTGHTPFSVPAAILITIAVATSIGLINGILVTLVRVPSIIVTLAMLMILRSLSVIVMGKGNITDLPDSFRFFGIGTLLGLRVSIWIMLAILAATWAMIRYTTVGRRIYAVGSNPHAATLAGLSVVRTKLFVFALTGFLVGIATFITPNGAIDNSTSSSGFELLVVTCIVVGGVSISGGIGTVSGVFLGVLLLQMQQTVLIFLKLSQNASNWNRAIQGALILIAVLVDHLAASRSRRSGGGGGGGTLMSNLTPPTPPHAKAGGMIEGDAAHTTTATDTYTPRFVTPTLWQRISPFTHEALLALLLVALLLAARQIDPSFMSIRPQRGLYQQVWDTALLALPMTFIIVTGGIDLSVGSIVALSSVALGITVSSYGAPFWVGMIVAVAVGAACGALNGIFITRVKVHPLIVTLATMSAFRGLAEGISLPNTYSANFPNWLTRFAKSPLRWDLWHGFIPYPSGFIPVRELRDPSPAILFYGFEITGWIFILLAIISLIILWKTRFGRTLYAMGFNETAARFSGLRVDRAKLAIYAFSGLVAGIVAINITAGQNTAKADVGVSMELEIITAVVLGGTSIFGGRGRIIGTLLGVALIHETRQFVSWHYHQDELVSVVLGLLLITSVAVNALLTRKSSRN